MIRSNKNRGSRQWIQSHLNKQLENVSAIIDLEENY